MRIAKSAPFTPEDREIVAHLVLHRRGVCWLAGLLTSSYETDKRDAERMYQLVLRAQDPDYESRRCLGTHIAAHWVTLE